MTSTPVSMDPRIRERRIEIKRQAGLKRLRVLLLAASVLIVIGIAYLVVESPLLDVDHVDVRGVQHESIADVRAAARVPNGAALLFVDTAAVTRRVQALPWVESVHVQRRLPGTLRVTVTEYVPTAFVRTGNGRVALVAPNGRVLAAAAAAPAGAVEIVGVRRVPAAGALLSPPDAADITKRLPARLGQQVSAVDVHDGGAVLRLAHGGEVVLGSWDDADAKGAAALAVLDHLHGASFAYIDVSSPSSPFVGQSARPEHD